MKYHSFLPGFEPLAKLSPLMQNLKIMRDCTLAKIEDQCARYFANDLLPDARARETPFSLRRTFWCLILQMLYGHTSCNEVVRQAQAMFLLIRPGGKRISSCNSAYCQARQKMPEPVLKAAILQSAKTASQLSHEPSLIAGKRLLLIDGTTVPLPDTPENQEAFPQQKFQKPGCGFPIARVLALGLLKGGGILDLTMGDYRKHELRLMQSLLNHIVENDVVVIDRIAGNYVVAAQMLQRGADLISRVAKRKIDFRKGLRLGKDDALFEWKKGEKRSPYLTEQQWAALPGKITVRVIRIRIQIKGFRSRQMLLVTTLLDPAAHPAEQIALAYLHRWKIELCMKNLKVTLGMDKLRCLKPATIRREIYGMIIAHNLARCLMAEAASTYRVPLARISFKGTIESFNAFAIAMTRAKTARHRRQLWDELLHIFVYAQVPLRPGRREPRVVKRRPKNFPRMTKPRHQYQHFRFLNAY